MLPSDSERLDELEKGQSQLGYLTPGKVENLCNTPNGDVSLEFYPNKVDKLFKGTRWNTVLSCMLPHNNTISISTHSTVVNTHFYVPSIM